MTMCDYCIEQGKCHQPKWITASVQSDKMYCESFRPVKMPIISMNSVASAFVTRNKSVTRRNWMPSTVKRFTKGTKFLAVTSNYGGEALGVGEITKDPYKENIGLNNTLAKHHDLYHAEGFAYLDDGCDRSTDFKTMSTLYSKLWDWINSNQTLTVVPFKIIEVFPGMKTKYTTDKEIVRCVKALARAIG